MNAIETLVTTVGNLTSNNNDAEKQQQYNLDLMEKQNEYNNAAMDKSFNYQKRMFNETGYAARVEQLKEAGLNPGLIYGMGSGAGGTTGSMPAVGSGLPSAPNVSQVTSNKIAASGMALQLAKLQSEIDVNKASANQMNTIAQKAGGIDTEKAAAETLKIQSDIQNINASTDLMYQQTKSEEIKQNLMDADLRYNRVRNEMQTATKDYQIERVAVDLEAAKWSIDEAIQNWRSLKAGADVDESTINAKINLHNSNVKIALKEILLKNAQIKGIESNMDLNSKKIEEITNSITQKYMELRQENEKISVSKQELKTRIQTTLMNNQVSLDNAKLDATVRLTEAYIKALTR